MFCSLKIHFLLKFELFLRVSILFLLFFWLFFSHIVVLSGIFVSVLSGSIVLNQFISLSCSVVVGKLPDFPNSFDKNEVFDVVESVGGAGFGYVMWGC